MESRALPNVLLRLETLSGIISKSIRPVLTGIIPTSVCLLCLDQREANSVHAQMSNIVMGSEAPWLSMTRMIP